MTSNDLRIEMMEAYSNSEEFFSEENFTEAYKNMLKASKIAKKIADMTYDVVDAKEYVHLSEHYYKKAMSYHDMIDDPKGKSVYQMDAPTKGFADFVGLDEAKKYLSDNIIAKWNSHDLSARKENAILIYGPHGVGKTRFVHSLIMELKAKAYYIQPLKHFSMTDFADVEHSFMNFFSQIEKEDNVVLFIESPVPYFSNGKDDFSKETSELFIRLFRNELKRIRKKNLNILLVATTSSPDKLSPDAFGNRLFDDFIRIHLPDEKIQKELIDRYFQHDEITKEQKEELLVAAKGFVTSSLTRLCKGIVESQAFSKDSFTACIKNFKTEDVSGYETNVDKFEETIKEYPILK